MLKVDLVTADGSRCKRGSSARVDAGHHQTYELLTPGGLRLVAQRDQLAIGKRQVAERLVAQAASFADLSGCVIYRAVVGSVAWGLAGAGSDVDRRGLFLLPFERQTSLFRQPAEIHDPDGGTAYWEIEKLLQLLLKGDAHAIELLWSPHVDLVTPQAQRILDRRREFLSNNVLGSFGRYALSQMNKIEHRLQQQRDAAIVARLVRGGTGSRDAVASALAIERWGAADAARLRQARAAVDALAGSLFDRGKSAGRDFASLCQALRATPEDAPWSERPYRPKNAYNLIRLLHSCLFLLEQGEPLIEVTGDLLRARLLEIKHGAVPVEEVIAEARALGRRLDQAADRSVLPDEPPYALADELLRDARREAARASVGLPVPAAEPLCGLLDRAGFPFSLPDEVWAFLAEQSDRGLFQLGLVGAHAYGFPSPDSDFDLKGIHLAPTSALLGTGPVEETRDTTRLLGGVEIDCTTHEAGSALRLLLRGNGNVLERLCSPYQLTAGPAIDRLRELARASAGAHFRKHYLGYFGGMLRELQRQGDRPGVKTLLYAYRVALTATHLLRTGECVLDLGPLAERYGYPEVPGLVAAKSAEQATLDGPPAAAALARLEAELQRAIDETHLPQEAPNAGEIERFLVDLRRSVGDGEQSVRSTRAGA